MLSTNKPIRCPSVPFNNFVINDCISLSVCCSKDPEAISMKVIGRATFGSVKLIAGLQDLSHALWTENYFSLLGFSSIRQHDSIIA